MCKLDDQESGLYPSIMFVAMVVYFLQQKEKSVLPVLHEVSANCVPSHVDVYVRVSDFVSDCN